MKTIALLALATIALLLNSCATGNSNNTPPDDTMPGMSQDDHSKMKM